MKFSYSLIKKLAPGKYTKEQLVEKLNLHSFETVDLGGDVLEITVTPNRFSDAASHLGIARETAAIFNLKLNDPSAKKIKYNYKDAGVFRINVKEKNLCRRYLAAYAAEIKIGPSPKWLKDILETCGFRSINNAVDIMNYVMLEIGQPLHAFDADKVSGGLVVRRAKNNETIVTIDNQKFNLNSGTLVIADAKQPLAIAGIKGGKSSEVSNATKRILVEAANFESANIYLTSKKLGLRTDASARFSHNLSPELAELGLRRALELLKELAGAAIHPPIDIYSKKSGKKLLPFNRQKISGLIGMDLKEKEILSALLKLGFKRKGKNLEAPLIRTDIENLEDVAEESARLFGYNRLPSSPPRVEVGAAYEEELILLKDQIRSVLTGAGFSEVYNYSLVFKGETGAAPSVVGILNGSPVELANPVSKQFAYLRDSLTSGLVKNLESNSRFFDEVRVFEIGNVFANGKKNTEATALGIALNSKDAILELKGLTETLFSKFGLTDYLLLDLNWENKLLKSKEALRLESDHQVFGYLGSLANSGGLPAHTYRQAGGKQGAVLEINLNKLLQLVNEEKEYQPLPKYPSLTRDLSIFVPEEARVGRILDVIQRVSAKLVQDVDLIDWFEPPAELHPKSDRSETGEKKRKSLTFRIVFQAEDRTLTDAEAEQEMAVISQALSDKFDAEIR